MNDRFLPVLVLAHSVAGCGNSQAGRAMNARVDTLASGRVVVANTGAPAWSPETARRLEENLRLGSAVGQGRESQQFGDIASVATDSRGRIYVLDLVAQEVRVFDRSGAFSHTIGRKGRGPGEFVGAWELTVGGADTLWVLDDVGARYSAFASDGTFLKGHRRRIIGYGSSLRRTVLHDGRYVDSVPASRERGP